MGAFPGKGGGEGGPDANLESHLIENLELRLFGFWRQIARGKTAEGNMVIAFKDRFRI